MSIRIIDVVWHHSKRGGIDLLLLLALADNADEHTRMAWPSVAYLARKCRVSEITIQRALRRMDGIEIEIKTRPGRANTYRLANLATEGYQPDTPTEKGISQLPGGNTAVIGGGNTAVIPEPSGTASNLQLETEGQEIAQGASASAHTREQVMKVNGRPATPRETGLAEAVLADWNGATGQSLTARSWLAMIVRRIREHPDLGLSEYQHLITAVLAHPWWEGPPSPNLVFGNDMQFEKSITVASTPHTNGKPKVNGSAMRYGRGMTPRQILDATQGT